MMNAAAVIVMFFGPSWGHGWAHQDYDCEQMPLMCVVTSYKGSARAHENSFRGRTVYNASCLRAVTQCFVSSLQLKSVERRHGLRHSFNAGHTAFVPGWLNARSVLARLTKDRPL